MKCIHVHPLQGNDRADKLVGKATLTCGLLLRRYEVLRSLRYYLQVKSQGHHTIDCLEERGMERGSARRSSLKGWEKAIIDQMNTGTVLKGTLGKLLRDRVERIWAFPSTQIPPWTKLNWTSTELYFHCGCCLPLVTPTIVEPPTKYHADEIPLP